MDRVFCCCCGRIGEAGDGAEIFRNVDPDIKSLSMIMIIIVITNNVESGCFLLSSSTAKSLVPTPEMPDGSQAISVGLDSR